MNSHARPFYASRRSFSPASHAEALGAGNGRGNGRARPVRKIRLSHEAPRTAEASGPVPGLPAR
jgi:hypothetical protein